MQNQYEATRWRSDTEGGWIASGIKYFDRLSEARRWAAESSERWSIRDGREEIESGGDLREMLRACPLLRMVSDEERRAQSAAAAARIEAQEVSER